MQHVSQSSSPGLKASLYCSVEGNIFKEQSQSLDRKQSEPTDKNRFSTDSNAERNEKQTKYTLSFGIYCEGDPTTHSLKCILINLQKTIRDILVQIAFVKTRKLGDEERYRPFNISVRAFKYLKYEYSNLIDIIVSLFDKPVKKTGTPVCVTCVKQKLLANNDVLNRILTDHGRGLKIVMRNESMNQGEGPCCSRDYPHVHADVQGKPVVLKYVLPVRTENYHQEKDPVIQNVKSEEQNAFPKLYGDALPKKKQEKETLKNEPRPYFEWPKNYFEGSDTSRNSDRSEKSKDEFPSFTNNTVSTPKQSEESKPKKSEDSKSKQSEESKPKPLEESKSKQSEELMSKQLEDSKSKQSEELKSKQSDESKPKPLEESKSKQSEELMSKQLEDSKSKQSEKLMSKQSEDSMSKQSEESMSNQLEGSFQVPQDLSANEEEFLLSESEYTVYCGCNIDEAYDKLNEITDQPTSPSSQNPSVYTATNEGTAKNPFGGEIVEAPVYISAADSLIINRRRLSEAESLHKLIQTTFLVNTAVDKNEMNYPESDKVKRIEEVVNEKLLYSSDPNTHSICSDPKQNEETEIIKTTDSFYLPLSPSLKSLPLDANDKDYFVVECGNISFADIKVVTEDEVYPKVYQWELDMEKNITDKRNLTMKSQGIVDMGSRKLSVSFKEEPVILPVIMEEEEIPIELQDKNKSSRPTSILRHNTELRYLSVDFHDYEKMSKSLKVKDDKSEKSNSQEKMYEGVMNNSVENLMYEVISLCTYTSDINK